jgi:hypothetical protein
MEWWILSGLAAAILVIGVLSRLRKPRRRPEGDKNIYPLW